MAAGGDNSLIESLSLVDALNAAVTSQASKVGIQKNYIGLLTNGLAAGNLGDGVKILSTSGGNLIGNSDPVSSVAYFNTSNVADFTLQPVTAWQGIRNDATPNQYLICGTTNSIGLLYIGSIQGSVGGQKLFRYLPEHSPDRHQRLWP